HIASKSSLTTKHGINTGAAVTDPDYPGQVKVLLYNMHAKNYKV
ncbi:unnamed protein product, partial [Tuber aestivum]